MPAGLQHVWDWAPTSGLLPADVYLRHCLLAMRKIGGAAERSFLRDTTLVDRVTPLGDYVDRERERIMAAAPPASMATRFGGRASMFAFACFLCMCVYSSTILR